MKKSYRLFSRYIFSDTLPLEGRILNLVILFGIIAAIFYSIARAVKEETPVFLIITLSIIIVAVTLLILSNKFRLYSMMSRLAVLLVCHILLPLLSFFVGGIDSGMPAYFVMSIVLIFLVLNGIECMINVALNMIIISFCYYFQYKHPGLIKPFDAEILRIADHLQITFTAGLFIGFVIKFQNSIYITEKRKADAASRAKADFLANVSHEIRTPLNAIIGLGELELRKKNDAETLSNLEKMYNSGQILLSIINDILDISKIESGKFELVPVDYNLPSLINDTVIINIVRIGSKPLSFKLKVNETLPTSLHGDELRIRQILNNILSNAFKYTRQGEVELFVDWENMSGQDKENCILIFTVRDTGMGIKPEDLEKLFSDYNQVNTQSNRNIEGTGLGLSITKQLVEMMNGSIVVQSEYGRGSTFTVRIQQKTVNSNPLGKKIVENLEKFKYAATRREMTNNLSYVQLPYARVLVVDDINTNLDVARGMLMPYGLGIDCVNSGRQAIERIKSGSIKYDAIFMDHMMPGMDGIEAVRIIREEIATDYAKNVPIIALTANALVGNDEMFLGLGFHDFISKPIDIKKLDNIVQKWIRNPEKEKSRAFKKDGTVPEGKNNPPVSLTDIDIEGLDIQEGLKRFANREESYKRILKSFDANMPALLDKIRSWIPVNAALLDGEDAERGKEGKEAALSEYTITIHGIKGSCYGIGAQKAGKMAEDLETASHRGDLDYIRVNTVDFIEKTESLMAEIRQKVNF
ncbi:MAG: response regulator [Treponema sp.]|jgi:signal transduction histidine kinase/DNA-binding response OmpR family regulator|nr:response regulator [Treponema sp.]